MRFSVSHRTTYTYKSPVARSQHVLHLRPRTFAGQKVLNHSLIIDPAPAGAYEVVDYFGNKTSYLRIEGEHDEFTVHARSSVDVDVAPMPNLSASAPWEQVAAQADDPRGVIDIEVSQFSCKSRHVPFNTEIGDFARVSFTPGRPVLEATFDLNRRIHTEFAFDPTATDVSTPVLRVLRMRRGVCQDFAHLTLAALRTLGLPARYVSGYLLTRPPPGQPKLQGADASHAWVSVWAPQTGWVDFDPTNGLIPHGEHITIAYGRDYEDISPISGILLGGGDQQIKVAVDVEPVAS